MIKTDKVDKGPQIVLVFDENWGYGTVLIPFTLALSVEWESRSWPTPILFEKGARNLYTLQPCAVCRHARRERVYILFSYTLFCDHLR